MKTEDYRKAAQELRAHVEWARSIPTPLMWGYYPVILDSGWLRLAARLRPLKDGTVYMTDFSDRDHANLNAWLNKLMQEPPQAN